MGFPTTLQEFQATFPDEKACWKALRKARWPRGFECPRCGYCESSWISTRGLEQCGQCRYQCSVTAGTVFHRTRLPLLTWFWAIFFVARHKKGISALQLQRDTGIGSYETAWTLLHRLRSVLRPRAQGRLAGLVEADESYVGGPDRRRRGGREVLNKSIVAVAVEHRGHSAGRARLAVLEGVTFERDLGPFLRGVIDARRTTLRTDGFPGYRPLEAAGIHHDRRVQGGNPARAGEILPWSHKIFGNLKTWLRGTFHGVSHKHLSRYMDEFVYRFDRRWRESELFGFVLRRAACGEPLAYHRLVAEPGR
jgi:transposase-like protein